MLRGGVGSAFLGLLLDPDPVRGPCLDPRKAAAFAQLDARNHHYI